MCESIYHTFLLFLFKCNSTVKKIQKVHILEPKSPSLYCNCFELLKKIAKYTEQDFGVLGFVHPWAFYLYINFNETTMSLLLTRKRGM